MGAFALADSTGKDSVLEMIERDGLISETNFVLCLFIRNNYGLGSDNN